MYIHIHVHIHTYLPARSIKESFPYSFPVCRFRRMIWNTAWERDECWLADVVPEVLNRQKKAPLFTCSIDTYITCITCKCSQHWWDSVHQRDHTLVLPWAQLSVPRVVHPPRYVASSYDSADQRPTSHSTDLQKWFYLQHKMYDAIRTSTVRCTSSMAI